MIRDHVWSKYFTTELVGSKIENVIIFTCLIVLNGVKKQFNIFLKTTPHIPNCFQMNFKLVISFWNSRNNKAPLCNVRLVVAVLPTAWWVKIGFDLRLIGCTLAPASYFSHMPIQEQELRSRFWGFSVLVKLKTVSYINPFDIYV